MYYFAAYGLRYYEGKSLPIRLDRNVREWCEQVELRCFPNHDIRLNRLDKIREFAMQTFRKAKVHADLELIPLYLFSEELKLALNGSSFVADSETARVDWAIDQIRRQWLRWLTEATDVARFLAYLVTENEEISDQFVDRGGWETRTIFTFHGGSIKRQHVFMCLANLFSLRDEPYDREEFVRFMEHEIVSVGPSAHCALAEAVQERADIFRWSDSLAEFMRTSRLLLRHRDDYPVNLPYEEFYTKQKDWLFRLADPDEEIESWTEIEPTFWEQLRLVRPLYIDQGLLNRLGRDYPDHLAQEFRRGLDADIPYFVPISDFSHDLENDALEIASCLRWRFAHPHFAISEKSNWVLLERNKRYLKGWVESHWKSLSPLVLLRSLYILGHNLAVKEMGFLGPFTSWLFQRVDHSHWFCRLEAMEFSRCFFGSLEGDVVLSLFSEDPERRATALLAIGLADPNRDEKVYQQAWAYAGLLDSWTACECRAMAISIRTALAHNSSLPSAFLSSLESIGERLLPLLQEGAASAEDNAEAQELEYARLELLLTCTHNPSTLLWVPFLSWVSNMLSQHDHLAASCSWQRIMRKLEKLQNPPAYPSCLFPTVQFIEHLQTRPQEIANQIQRRIGGK